MSDPATIADVPGALADLLGVSVDDPSLRTAYGVALDIVDTMTGDTGLSVGWMLKPERERASMVAAWTVMIYTSIPAYAREQATFERAASAARSDAGQ